MEAQMLDEFLNNLLTIVNQETKNNFNGILVNYYENGNNLGVIVMMNPNLEILV